MMPRRIHFLLLLGFSLWLPLSSCLSQTNAAPTTSREWNKRGIELAQDKEWNAAIEAFTRAMQIDPSNPDPFLNRAIVHSGLKQWPQAEADTTRCIELNPDNPRAWHQRAVARSQQGKTEAAFQDASRACRMQPASADFVFTRYLTTSRLGRHDLGHYPGEAYIGTMSWSDPWSPYMALLNHVALRRAGNEAEAKSILDEALQWVPAGTWPLPVIQYLRGELAEAELMNLATDNDRLTLARYYIGTNQWLDGDAASARVHFEWIREHGNPNFLQSLLASDYLAELDSN